MKKWPVLVPEVYFWGVLRASERVVKSGLDSGTQSAIFGTPKMANEIDQVLAFLGVPKMALRIPQIEIPGPIFNIFGYFAFGC